MRLSYPSSVLYILQSNWSGEFPLASNVLLFNQLMLTLNLLLYMTISQRERDDELRQRTASWIVCACPLDVTEAEQLLAITDSVLFTHN